MFKVSLSQVADENGIAHDPHEPHEWSSYSCAGCHKQFPNTVDAKVHILQCASIAPADRAVASANPHHSGPDMRICFATGKPVIVDVTVVSTTAPSNIHTADGAPVKKKEGEKKHKYEPQVNASGAEFVVASATCLGHLSKPTLDLLGRMTSRASKPAKAAAANRLSRAVCLSSGHIVAMVDQAKGAKLSTRCSDEGPKVILRLPTARVVPSADAASVSHSMQDHSTSSIVSMPCPTAAVNAAAPSSAPADAAATPASTQDQFNTINVPVAAGVSSQFVVTGLNVRA
jgi:hypothetical protein